MVVVGAGHNGLVAAAYLSQAGLSVLVLERLAHVGGAAVSSRPFAGAPALVSPYAYLVSLFPDQIVRDLGLRVQFRSRRTASYTPVIRGGRHTGLLVEGRPGQATEDSFEALTGSSREFAAWRQFQGRLADLAGVVAPSMVRPLEPEASLRDRADPETWRMVVEEPIADAIEAAFADDAVRGLVASDALIGTFSDLPSHDLDQNRCFLYHVVGNGTGQWRVPVGGMGALSAAIETAARQGGSEVLTDAFVTRVAADGRAATVTFEHADAGHEVGCSWVLGNVSPWVVRLLLGENPGPRPEGSQLKVTMLLDRLPRLRAGISAPVAFAGTLHVAEGYAQLQQAFCEAQGGALPQVPPGELYCHSLSDPSVLGPMAMEGRHTLSYFGLHAPARLYSGHVEAQRDEHVLRVLDAVNTYLEEPIETLVSLDAQGNPCLQAKVPQDIEDELAMPGGHIFHGPLSWPWATGEAPPETPAQRWGAATEVANVLLCGAGSVRGGAVSGIGGHNAAMAVLETAGRGPAEPT